MTDHFDHDSIAPMRWGNGDFPSLMGGGLFQRAMAVLEFFTAATRAGIIASDTGKRLRGQFTRRAGDGLATFVGCGVGHVAQLLTLGLDGLSGFGDLFGRLDLHRHQHACDFVLDRVQQLPEQFKSFTLVFLLGLLLRVAAQVDALAQVVQRAQVLAPVGVDALQQHHAHEGRELLGTDLFELGLKDLQPWDVAYASERLREVRYAYSEDEVKQYLTEPRVMKGLFHVVQTLFGVTLEDCEVQGWHPDVRAAAVIGTSGEKLGYLMMDLYARPAKQGGAWVDSERTRRNLGTHIQSPIVNLTCNFARPQGDRPALWTHDDVITLFHESGHALHALLSEVDEAGAAAFASVEWDAIELPSQFMENFCWEWSVLQQLTAHVDTGEHLPRDLFDRMTAARNFQSGMHTVRQIEFALFDILLHSRDQGLTIAEVLTQLDQVREEVAVMHPPAWHRFPHSFSHLFAGGYGAGYYSYKWAEVLSSDAFEAFEEAAQRSAKSAHAAAEALGALDRETGLRFKKEILAVGGERPAAESFQAFRGRAPRMDALLRHSGMTDEQK